ncbi:hypothetical protein TS71_25200 [Mycolicibacterium neoaurum]|uniref:Uncharacterized protein n=1 Tax=Mycolicibacterium neoaurum VKM Ac-1815D TaxID=700508 RepID=V5XIC8_MYCNE|nr:hypothetical protein D174_00120 [Mycolicibacterium neoaurum VKM Ac-1815D]AMO03861.1 hypothetical protein MyAD_00115 [Mycolicibacterium neoaurum]KJQ47736.1 hypothetical protein TS71_25200 [Mycolicibacterium neoaurum]KUM05740.1 hypothetical protein AVZ31_25155 [Mycolicibacterium neoaurum]
MVGDEVDDTVALLAGRIAKLLSEWTDDRGAEYSKDVLVDGLDEFAFVPEVVLDETYRNARFACNIAKRGGFEAVSGEAF